MNVKIARLKKHMTQNELCEKVGICRSFLSRIENGKDGNVTKEGMLKLASILETDVVALFFE